ncbi:MAG: hypothetical protein HQK89_04770 [Nitrospirae bacterium]|nr:hypothetical protein [Nitrospirota bacterium]
MSPELALILSPAVFALLSLYFRSGKVDRYLIAGGAAFHFVLTLSTGHGVQPAGALLGADNLSYLFLLILSVVFLSTSFYNVSFIGHMGKESKFELLYVPMMFAFLSATTGVILSRHLGLTWIFIEAATLASAPLIGYYRGNEFLEALWKYLFICSVGIALSFIGVIAMVEASKGIAAPQINPGLNVDALGFYAKRLSPLWGGLAFVFAIAGYGTMMGLAPMHKWLPDTHTLAPSPVSAMLSGALLNCAFLSLLRYYQIFASTPLIAFFRPVLIVMGTFSIFVSAVYVLRVHNFKRKLSYSSIGHMGILATGIGLGGTAIYGAMLYTLCHCLAKNMMFLTTGNFSRAFGTMTVSTIRDGINKVPVSSWLLLTGVFALAGFPPSGIFLGQFIMLKQMVTAGNWFVFVIFTTSLSAMAYGMVKSVVEMVFSKHPESGSDRIGQRVGGRIGGNADNRVDKPADGNADDHIGGRVSEDFLSVFPQWVLIILLVALGLGIPGKLNELLSGAASLLGWSLGGF